MHTDATVLQAILPLTVVLILMSVILPPAKMKERAL